jgi:hypothetical protein
MATTVAVLRGCGGEHAHADRQGEATHWSRNWTGEMRARRVDRSAHDEYLSSTCSHFAEKGNDKRKGVTQNGHEWPGGGARARPLQVET